MLKHSQVSSNNSTDEIIKLFDNKIDLTENEELLLSHLHQLV